MWKYMYSVWSGHDLWRMDKQADRQLYIHRRGGAGKGVGAYLYIQNNFVLVLFFYPATEQVKLVKYLQ